MAENYGIRAGLGPDYESKYHMRAQSAPENIGVNSEAMDFQMPYRATFLNGLPESKADYVSALAHGMNSNDDDASNSRYQKLLERREELKKQIAQISADIAYQEKLRALEMKNDPMWDIAKQQYIMKGDSSGLESIMSRIEAEKGRKAAEDLALLNKSGEEVSKIDAYKKNFRTKLAFANNAFREMKNENNAENRRAAFNYYVELMGAADDLKMPKDVLEKYMSPDFAAWAKGQESLRAAGMGGLEFVNSSELENSIKSLIEDKKFNEARTKLNENAALFSGGTTSTEFTNLKDSIDNAEKKYNKGAPARQEDKNEKVIKDEVARINAIADITKRAAEAANFISNHPDRINTYDKKTGMLDSKLPESKKVKR